MKCIIIGLGNYGSELAEKLTALGNEVIGVDINEYRVDTLKNKVATTFIIDATDETSLSVLPLHDVDIVIIAIGEDFGASVRVVALMKKKQVKHVYARAIDDLHKAILEAFNVDKILTPESDAAHDLVQMLNFGLNVESFKVNEEYYVLKFSVPESFYGSHLNALTFDEDFNVKLIALNRGLMVYNLLGVSVLKHTPEEVASGDYVIQENDEIVCYGQKKNLSSLLKTIQRQIQEGNK